MTKTYVLGMFPYPSGEGLHVGHGRIFSAVDVMGRYMKMKHGNALVPMGWDAFGLPAENAAIKAKKNPIDMVPKNYSNFRAQMKNLSFDFDWKHEFATTDPTYYGFTQWLFLHLYEAGLVYREEVAINWCPKCLTGLANEEVMGDGTHERCGTVVTKKSMPQWVMKITNYAQRLLEGLDENLDWPRGILEMQRNWIGKKEGINISYQVVGHDEKIVVFTTTPVNFGATFLVLAPEHGVVAKVMNGEYKVNEDIQKSVIDYFKKTQQKSEVDRMVEGREKTGVFTGLYVKNHVTGEDIPVWISDFALAHVGTGAVQGCPGHDLRDFEFAQKFNIPIKRVVVGEDGDESEIVKKEQLIEKGMKGKMINSDFLNGVDFKEAMGKTMDYFEEKGWGNRSVTWHLRDWVFSRQRYWGEPIPLVYCDKCGDSNGVVPLTEKDLPLELPYLESYEPTDTGESPLSRINEWVNTKCPKCGGPARRETDTMPNWAGSCWYFLAFPWWSEETKSQLDEFKKKSETPYTDFWKEVAKPEIDKWLPVDWYLGGAEHAVLHLLYARFWVKVFQDKGLLDFSEPFLRLRSVGMVLAEDGKKMSKSLGNVINPDEMVAKFGSDSVRLYEMFMGPWDQAISWDTRSLIGQKRFIERIGETVKKIGDKTSPILSVNLVKLGEKVERGIVEQKFNTAIASIMEFVNLWRGEGLVMSKNDVNKFAQLLSPFAPQTAQAVWESSSLPVVQSSSVSESEWPTFDEVGEMAEVPVTIAVQVNGKLRATVEIEGSKAKIESEVMKIVMENEQVKKWAPGDIKKTIFIPGKIVNLVV